MRKLFLALLVLIYLVGFSTAKSDSYAMMQKLSPEQRDEAIKFGKRNVKTDVRELIKEWSVDNGKNGFAFIVTEYLALAFAARQAALQSSELNNFDIEDTLAKSSGKLVFQVSVLGNTDSFSKDYTAVLRIGDKTFPSTYWNNPPGEASDDGKTFEATSDYYFPAEGIDPSSVALLVVQDKDGKEIAKFSFNLSKMR
ncbi:MAG: hypothetical protein HY283_04775 [Nitrospirae bacterium]|nr:hypothetical protein [Nitrospirota bacterium]